MYLPELPTVAASREGNGGQKNKDGGKIVFLCAILCGFNFLNSELGLYLYKQSKECLSPAVCIK